MLWVRILATAKSPALETSSLEQDFGHVNQSLGVFFERAALLKQFCVSSIEND
jgi:hypothetical protein